MAMKTTPKNRQVVVYKGLTFADIAMNTFHASRPWT